MAQALEFGCVLMSWVTLWLLTKEMRKLCFWIYSEARENSAAPLLLMSWDWQQLFPNPSLRISLSFHQPPQDVKALLLLTAEMVHVPHNTGLTAIANFDPNLAEVEPWRTGVRLVQGWILSWAAQRESQESSSICFCPLENKFPCSGRYRIGQRWCMAAEKTNLLQTYLNKLIAYKTIGDASAQSCFMGSMAHGKREQLENLKRKAAKVISLENVALRKGEKKKKFNLKKEDWEKKTWWKSLGLWVFQRGKE